MSRKPLWRKLGYRRGLVAHVDEAPGDYRQLVPRIPQDVRLDGTLDDAPRLIHHFTTDAEGLRARLAVFKDALASRGAIWVSYPKKASGIVTAVTGDVVRAAVEHTRVGAEAKGVGVVIGKKSHLWTLGDRAMLTTAVQNLVANAIAFSSAGGHVGVGLRSRDGIVEIAVSDQGIGIAEDDLDRVFERFYRTDQARSRSTGGTGLGLSIVKHIAENHGGEARVWSRLGRGSTFTIRLPEIPAPASARTPRREKERA